MTQHHFRHYLNLLDNLLTEDALSDKDLESLKAAISSKIRSLPADDATMQALKEIEDLLKNVGAGGRMGIINGQLKSIEDPTVDAARKQLARFIMSIPQTPDQRNELFDLWRSDKLLDTNKLLSVGKLSFDQVVKNYNSNPLIKELVNELMHIAALGQGKGEFGLSALSKKIHKQEGKGDLSINGRAIEVKTTDGGAGRFTDQEVRPAAGFEQAATELNEFVSTHPTVPISLPGSGLSLGAAVSFLAALTDKKEKDKYLNLVEKVITKIFGGAKNSDIDSIMSAIQHGNVNEALQAYSKAGFNFYMSKKKDEGVLYINVLKEPITTVFFKDADELAKSSLRFHAQTPYITSTADVRLPYPQTEIVDTTFGANALVAKQKKDAATQAKQDRMAARQTAADLKAQKLQDKVSGNQGGGLTKIRPPGTPTNSAPRGRGRR